MFLTYTPRLMTHRRYLIILTILLIAKAIWACYEIATGYIGLAPDEAQYWTWSQHLDWGFYSKPPGIAWQIWLGSKLWGNTELGIRFASVIICLLTSYAVYFLAKASNLKPGAAFTAAFVFIVSPIGMMGNFAATTDGGLILFWVLTALVFTRNIQQEKPPNYLAIGLLIALGALFKWPIYLFWVFIALFSIIHVPKKSYLKLALGMSISFLGLLPSIIWNRGHEWATFRHVFTQSTGGHSSNAQPLFHGNFFDFIASQMGVLSPIFFILLILSIIYVARKYSHTSLAIRFCTWVCIGVLGIFCSLAVFSKMQANWALYAYPTGVITLAWFACDIMKRGRVWIIWGSALSFSIVLLGILIPFIQNHNILSQKPIPYKVNPFRHSLGWSNLRDALQEIDYDPQQHFLFSDTYQMTSILSFYDPYQKQAYFLNIDQKRKNQFSFWPSMADKELANTGYYVWYQNTKDFMKDYPARVAQHIEKLKPFFESVEFVRAVPLFSCYNTVTKGALIYKCVAYNGKKPLDPRQY